ncbi:MAG: hypothetical protein WC710_14865 [Gallionella sp.]|jgi:hypothetical protein
MPTIAEVRQKYPQYADMSDDNLAQALHKKYYADIPYDDFAGKIGINAAPKPAAEPDTFLGMDTGKLKAVGQGAGDLVGGLVRGAGSIGSTILAPYDMAKDAINGKGLSLESNRARRAGIDGGLQEIGANPDSAMYKTGKIAGEIAGTAGAGGVLANGVRAVSTAPRAVAFANALQTGGMRAGATPGAANMLTRVAGGATTGGAMAGMVDPESAGTGALIGGALPPGLKIAGEAGKLIRKGAGAATTNLLGASTGTGAESISGAFNAGKQGSTKFLDNMRGKVSFDDVVGEAKGALGKMREARAADYRSGMVDISNDKSVIDFKPVQDAMRKIGQMGSYKGQQINKNAAGTVDDLMATVDNWASLNPAEYHTPEGLDALKQAIGDIRDSTQFGTAARRATDEVYNAVKNQITAQAPTYSKVMKDYSEASALLKEIESGLSLGSKASKDTAVRKLQSLLRNNAQTNYGNRLNLASQLEQKGGADLMPALAGQSMSSVMPRGLSGGIQKAGALGIGVTSPGTIPALLAAAPFTSPRLVGEGLYGLGRLTGGASNALTAGKQGLNQLAGPGLLEAQNALYRSIPVMATSANQTARQ